MNIVTSVDKRGIAKEMGVEKGDALISINGKAVKDIFDYRYLILDEYLEVLIKKASGEEWLLEVEKDEDEDLGVEFENGLMDEAKSCRNKCIFCFIDQLPKGMRKTLYFKDDDSRLSFLSGNYVTLTNMSDEEMERIIYYHLSPINISVHATDTETRKYMLKNPNAVNIDKQINKLFNAGIDMNFQIVLCKGINDGAILNKSIEDLSRYIPRAKSLSVVPAGLTKHRDGLCDIVSFSKDDALEVINQIHAWQKSFKNKFVFAADEFYIKAELPLPKYKDYGEFWQIENGVGMLRMFLDECEKELSRSGDKNHYSGAVSVATGAAAYEFILDIAERVNEKYPGITVLVYKIENNFFGESITVSGLMTGQDLNKQLSGKNLGKCLLIPENAIKKDETVFLDDMSVASLEEMLKVKIHVTKVNGGEFIKNIKEAAK